MAVPKSNSWPLTPWMTTALLDTAGCDTTTRTGGATLATIATLFCVPIVYTVVRRKGYHEFFAE